MIDHLIFDTTDYVTIDDTHSVGAFVRSGKSGALVTHHASPEAGDITFTFVDGDVTVGSDSIAETGHGLVTGDVIRLTTSGTLPVPLATGTDYYVIRVDNNNFKLALTAEDAERGIAIDITSAAGGGTHTVTEQEVDRRALDVWMVNPIDVNITQDDEITVFQGTDPWIVAATDLDIRDLDAAQDSIASWTHDGAGTAITSTAENGDQALDVHISNTEIAVIQGSDAPWSVEATDLDIRDLVHTQDSVRLGDGTSFLTSTTIGGDIGLDVNMINDPALANGTMLTTANVLDVAGTSENVVASALPNRKYLFIYNYDNTKVFIGGAGVTEADGFPVSPGSTIALRAGAAVDVEFVGQTAKTPEIRTLELS